MKKRVVKGLALLPVLFLLAQGPHVYGEETTSTSSLETSAEKNSSQEQYKNEETLFFNQFNYVISQPKNQKKSVADRLELLMTESAQQVIAVTLVNKTDQKLVLLPNVYQATTAASGELVYEADTADKLLDSSYQVTDIFEYPERIEIPEKGSVELQLTIKMPAEKFEGQLLYGLTLSDEQNQYHQLVTPIALYESDGEVTPDLVLKEVRYDDKKGKVHLKIENPALTTVSALEVKYQIDQDAKNQVKGQLNNVTIAPLSIYEFSVDVDYLDIQTNGLTLSLKNSLLNKEWKKTILEDTTTEKKASTTDNTGIIDLEKQQSLQWAILLLTCMAILLSGATLLYALYQGKAVPAPEKAESQIEESGEEHE